MNRWSWPRWRIIPRPAWKKSWRERKPWWFFKFKPQNWNFDFHTASTELAVHAYMRL